MRPNVFGAALKVENTGRILPGRESIDVLVPTANHSHELTIELNDGLRCLR